MTTLFAGSEFDAFLLYGEMIFVTGDTRYDPDFARIAMVPRGIGYVQADFTSQTEGWLHFGLNLRTINDFAQNTIFLSLIDSNTGQDVLVIDGDSGIFNLQYWDGVSTFVELSPAIPFLSSVNHAVDIHWKIADSGGIFEIYLDGILVTSFTGDTLL